MALDLVSRAQAGDQRAFEQLMEQHVTDIYRLATAIVGEADARDTTQETFVQAWTQLARLRDVSAFPAWLRRICVNRSRNWLRARARRGPVSSIDEPGADAHALADQRGDFRTAVEDRELLDAAFQRLSADQRVLLALHYSMGYSIAEVVVALELPVGTVKSRLNAALTAIRRTAGAANELATRGTAL
jgi:RNA polymerase sigma-70 factor (ECF subfamily)